MAMELSCAALVATVGRSASATIALIGVVLICQVIAFQHISDTFSTSSAFKSKHMIAMPLMHT